MRTDLKKLALQAFTSNRIESIVFYVRRKPPPEAHILLQLQYKNDNKYRVYLRYKNGYAYSHHFNNSIGLMQSIGFVTMLDDMRAENGAKKSLPEMPVPEEWNEMEQIEFNRRQMQKLLHLR